MTNQSRRITVVSGKGGTGKTTVMASFATIAKRSVLADCDVDAANLHLLLQPDVGPPQPYRGAKIAVRDPERCNGCGICEETCRFEAITSEAIDTMACEGCGACVLTCPRNALELEPTVNGHFHASKTQYGPMAHARLLPGGESSGRLVTRVRELADELAENAALDGVTVDGPPGIGCTAVASMADVGLAIVVTEPTLSGISDMERVVQLAEHFGHPVAVIINKADLNEANRDRIRRYCRECEIPVLAELPFDETVVRAISAQVPLVEYDPDGPVAAGIREAWERAVQMLSAPAP